MRPSRKMPRAGLVAISLLAAISLLGCGSGGVGRA